MQSYEYDLNVKDNGSYKDDIDIENDDDETLAGKVALRLQDCKKIHDERCVMVKENMAMFDGNIEAVMKSGDSAKYNSKALKNVIFLTIRNMVGLSTDHPPVPDVSPAKDTPPSQKKARIVAKSLECDMVRTKFQDRLGMMLFDTYIKNDSFLHWFWNYDINDNDFIEATVEEISFAPGSSSTDDCEYLVYHPWKNRKWWKANYKEFYSKIKFESVRNDISSVDKSAARGSSARLIAYWEDDIRIEQVMGIDGEWIILKKSQNPYWEYRSTDEQIMTWVSEMFPQVGAIAQQTGIADEEGVKMLMSDPSVNPDGQIGQMDDFTPIINFLEKPTKPFVQISSIKLMGDLYSKNLIGQIKQIFLDLNMKKRQIADNLRGCNTKLIVDSNSFNEAEAYSITDEPLQVLRADFSVNPKPVYFAETTNFPLDKILVDMQDDNKYIDDVFGHHEISRGTGNAGTLGQDQMNLESDRTPIRYQVRAIESAIVELWKGWIQLKKMFYTDVHYIKRMGATDGMEVLKLMSKDIESGIDPILRPMSTAPMSKQARAQQSMVLYQQQALDPYTLYQDLERNDPQMLTNRLLNWVKFGMISADDPQQLQADMQNHSATAGDSTETPIERADQENKSMQGGDEVPPTPPELVTLEHVKLHMVFLKDPKNKMEQDAMDNFQNHIATDKATLIEITKSGMLNQASNEVNASQQTPQK